MDTPLPARDPSPPSRNAYQNGCRGVARPTHEERPVAVPGDGPFIVCR